MTGRAQGRCARTPLLLSRALPASPRRALTARGVCAAWSLGPDSDWLSPVPGALLTTARARRSPCPARLGKHVESSAAFEVPSYTRLISVVKIICLRGSEPRPQV